MCIWNSKSTSLYSLYFCDRSTIMALHGLSSRVWPRLVISLLWSVAVARAQGMFEDRSSAIPQGTSQLNYGVAVTNVGDGDGPMEWVVAGFSGANLVLQYDVRTRRYRNIAEEDSRFAALKDPQGAAIGVCACDIDGDGLEEIYFLNTNNRYSGPKLVRDRLFKWRNNRYEDLFSDNINANVSSMYSGRSVACVDRTGSGKYGILLATYAQDGGGKFGLIEMNEYHAMNDVPRGQIVLHNVAEAVGIDFSTGGRGITVGPIIGDDGFSDIYFVNEGNMRLGNRGDNSLFVNDGQGRFTNMAAQTNLNDAQPGRGVTLADFNNDGKTDIVYGNWMGPHRLQIQNASSSQPTFFNAATPEFATPSPIRTVIAADFDNSGNLQVFMNNIVYRGAAPNNLYRILPEGANVSIVREDIGAAEEPAKHGTGAAVADIDQDGVLELLVAHGESKSQGLTFYHVTRSKVMDNKWLRVMPLTQYGAPARGAKVSLTLSDGRNLTRIIDGGSGYLCEMEPVAHFGIGMSADITSLHVVWPDNHKINMMLNRADVNKMMVISHTGSISKVGPAEYSNRGVYDTKIGPDGRDSTISQGRRGYSQRRPDRSQSLSRSQSRHSRRRSDDIGIRGESSSSSWEMQNRNRRLPDRDSHSSRNQPTRDQYYRRGNYAGRVRLTTTGRPTVSPPTPWSRYRYRFDTSRSRTSRIISNRDKGRMREKQREEMERSRQQQLRAQQKERLRQIQLRRENERRVRARQEAERLRAESIRINQVTNRTEAPSTVRETPQRGPYQYARPTPSTEDPEKQREEMERSRQKQLRAQQEERLEPIQLRRENERLMRARQEAERLRAESIRINQVTNRTEAPSTVRETPQRGPYQYARPTSSTEDPRRSWRRYAEHQRIMGLLAGAESERRMAARRESRNHSFYRSWFYQPTLKPSDYRSNDYNRRLMEERRRASLRAEEERRRNSFRRAELDRRSRVGSVSRSGAEVNTLSRGSAYDRNYISGRWETSRRRYEPRPRVTIRPEMAQRKTTLSPYAYVARRRQEERDRGRLSRDFFRPDARSTRWGRRADHRNIHRARGEITPRPTSRSYGVDRRRYYGHGSISGPERYRSADRYRKLSSVKMANQGKEMVTYRPHPQPQVTRTPYTAHRRYMGWGSYSPDTRARPETSDRLMAVASAHVNRHRA
ncbi:hypothetical protein EGW08_006339 [Elysia chlorotica]|uniref:ASPIC/UnbV domain-containing protein n=1 Tax=Elysia chlorotica TaxID=188477 RepID=A0A433TWH5_ELYCH|nr:hypothetical protein EGW08_006339 [Elysia chlorotica]